MKHFLLIIGVFSFILSFFVHKYFIQFIILSIFFVIFYILKKNSQEIESLKKIIEEHNGLLKEDLKSIKKSEGLLN